MSVITVLIKELIAPQAITLFFISLVLSCTFNGDSSGSEPVEVDFKEPEIEEVTNDHHNSNSLTVVVSAMISPKETYSYYEELFNYISEKLDKKVEFKQRKTYQEANELIINGQVDLGFICSGAYIRFSKSDSVEILAVPVVNNKPMYQAYIIANKSSKADRFEQLKGGSFAFTDPMSNTGKLYAINRLKGMGKSPEEFFLKTIFSYGHDVSIQMVNKKLVDAATIDGLVFDYFTKVKPEDVSNIKIIEKSEFYGIPPIVCPKNLPYVMKNSIRDVIFNMHNDERGKAILDKLLIEKFIPGNDQDYNSIRKMYSLVRQ